VISPENSAKFCSTTSTQTSSLDPTPTRTRRHGGPSHASRLSSHRADSPLHEHFPYDLCIASKAYAKDLSACRAGKEIASEYSDSNPVSDYNSDSNPVSDYYSDSSYEFDFGADPDELESDTYTTEQPLSGPTYGLVLTSTLAGRFVYWPDRKPADLTDENSRCIAYLDSLPF
jgi:hypothetical protein